MMGRDGTALAIAVAAAFSASMLSVSEHVRLVSAGYELAAARREGEALRRETVNAERRVALLRLPTAVAARARAMKLDLELPRNRRVLTQDEVAQLVGPRVAPPTTPSVPSRTPEVQAR